jgi:hypothetical protein
MAARCSVAARAKWLRKMKNANGIEFFSLLKCFWRYWRALLSQKHQSGKSEKWSQVRSYLVELHCGFIFNLIILLLAAFARHNSRKCKFLEENHVSLCFLMKINLHSKSRHIIFQVK